MRTRISALIIDPHNSDHDYSLVTTLHDPEYSYLYGEKGFDISVISDTSNILSELNKNSGVDCIITLGEESDFDFCPLNVLSFEFRKKWIHMKEFNPDAIARNIIDVFLYNINRTRDAREIKLFSIFTCTFNTPKKMFERLYNSLLNQSYRNWNWFILDDSTSPTTSEMIAHYRDPRITVIKNVTNHGNIGFNKHLIASICDGDYLVEVDHDDELTPDCLELLNKAFEKYPESDFVYSHAMEFVNGHEIYYSDGFAYGLGKYEDFEVNGVKRHIALTADVNAVSVRGIHALPNHVRCWTKSFYHAIGGHNTELSVLDDMDILIRTFIYGKMTKVHKVLYIQHEGENTNRRDGSTTQSKRFDEIQRTNDLLRKKYDEQIHDRLIELGSKDPVWIKEVQRSNLNMEYDKSSLIALNNIYIPE